MCGLVGCIRDDALYKSIEGLKKLEYRGYDSCGIAFYNKSLHIYKSLKGVFDLSKKVYKKQASIAIAHTRWATHGKVSLKNAHPHKGDRIILVHNGIISNYQELKQKYSLSTKSDTDTEVALKLIEYFYKNDLLDAINKAVELFNGSYSMIIMDINDLSKLYFIKNKTPLYISKNIISSDISLFDYKDIYYSLEDNTIGYVTCDDYYIYKGLVKTGVVDKNDIYNLKRNKYYMLDEIEEIPNIINNYKNMIIDKNILKLINNCDCINIIGCGSSYNASLLGEYFFKQKNKNARAYIASECDNIYITKNPLFIYVSQSGETLDIIKAYHKFKEYNNIVITNNKSSLLYNLCNNNILLNVNKEISVAATKTYIAEVLLFYILAGNNDFDDLDKKVLSLNIENIKLLAKKIKNVKQLFLIGSGISYISLLEGALKLKEIAYINTLTIPQGELKHGTLALIRKGSNLVLFKGLNKSLINYSETLSRKAKGFILDSYLGVDIIKEIDIIIGIIGIYYLTYYIALYNKYSIDKPLNLAKSVTVE